MCVFYELSCVEFLKEACSLLCPSPGTATCTVKSQPMMVCRVLKKLMQMHIMKEHVWVSKMFAAKYMSL